ncbi:hypothetical protein RI129_011610 [Pyrocoelia pectoralis]|uniref:Uncharacterized protein n=1 Tax=Pyrocoelia pectoralis TaxID=417401 RepID=A0AAN7V1Y0_9COLE
MDFRDFNEDNTDTCIFDQYLTGSRPSSANRDDKEARIKTFKERQNEERQRKLDEMKNQALAAQRFKEQKENERRQRLDELRLKEDERRQQVEERKKAINDAERDRLESILKRNQEREARIEAKRKNERSSMVFAFGSSTPRMLGPADSSGSFWGHRRATSTQNITYSPAPLTRRQSERELDGGSKKRATSAGGLERSGEDMRMSTSMYAVFHWDTDPDASKSPIASLPAQPIFLNASSNSATTPQHPAGCISGYVGRRRTDLMPTIPAKDSPTTVSRKPFMRSPAPSRPSSSLSQQSTSSVTSSVVMRSRPSTAPRGPRPASIAITGITTDIKNGADCSRKPDNKPPLPKVRKSSLVKSQEKIGKKKSLASPTDGSPKTLLSPTNNTPVTTTAESDITNTLIYIDKHPINYVTETISNEDKLVFNGQDCSIELDNKQPTMQ